MCVAYWSGQPAHWDAAARESYPSCSRRRSLHHSCCPVHSLPGVRSRWCWVPRFPTAGSCWRLRRPPARQQHLQLGLAASRPARASNGASDALSASAGALGGLREAAATEGGENQARRADLRPAPTAWRRRRWACWAPAAWPCRSSRWTRRRGFPKAWAGRSGLRVAMSGSQHPGSSVSGFKPLVPVKRVSRAGTCPTSGPVAAQAAFDEEAQATSRFAVLRSRSDCCRVSSEARREATGESSCAQVLVQSGTANGTLQRILVISCRVQTQMLQAADSNKTQIVTDAR